ncbi:MAG: ferrous iron transport protein A [Firmicutes bacterium]|uniref:Ferrous iron transport protein A n=1 Tax=Candidatus Scatoplasma merdavium TaxID=2840932 RepID=A0A9D9GR39_9BACL|nr:ferrous iron transport protein A [Candidatus Scatoplasma merdavium]
MEETNELTLEKLAVGDYATVVTIKGEGQVRRRLFDMGITPGAEIYLRKKAPLGDPIEINIRGYELTLRKVEANAVVVKRKVVK